MNPLRHFPAAWLATCVFASAAISIESFTPATNDRFANDPAFAAQAYDWSGVGRDGDGHWATMIAPNVFLSANHHHPADGASLTFYPGNNPSATPVTMTVAGGQRIGSTDLWVGQLTATVPSSIAVYEFSADAMTQATFGSSAYANYFAYMSGISPTVADYGASSYTSQAVGTNRLEGYMDNFSESGTTGDVMLLAQNLASDSFFAHTTYESFLQVGDSGSPLMLPVNTPEGPQLFLAGIAWSIATGNVLVSPGNTQQRNISIYTYTGNEAGEIQNFINSVPEPTSTVFLLASGTLLLLRRKRSLR